MEGVKIFAIILCVIVVLLICFMAVSCYCKRGPSEYLASGDGRDPTTVVNTLNESDTAQINVSMSAPYEGTVWPHRETMSSGDGRDPTTVVNTLNESDTAQINVSMSAPYEGTVWPHRETMSSGSGSGGYGQKKKKKHTPIGHNHIVTENLTSELYGTDDPALHQHEMEGVTIHMQKHLPSSFHPDELAAYAKKISSVHTKSDWDPETSDSRSNGFNTGHIWHNVASNKKFVLEDDTPGFAKWIQVPTESDMMDRTARSMPVGKRHVFQGPHRGAPGMYTHNRDKVSDVNIPYLTSAQVENGKKVGPYAVRNYALSTPKYF
jgi:hypothetical protein